MYSSRAASLASASCLHLVLTRTHVPSILKVACQARLRGRLKTRMSPSKSVTVSELNLGIELLYDIVSVQQYALAQKSLPVH